MFVVKKRFGRNETRLSDFTKEQAAVDFIIEKLKEDRSLKLIATYGLYEGADLLKEYTQHDIPASAQEQSASDTSVSQRGSGKSFAPTPFDTTPRMGPKTWVRDDGKNEDDNKDA